MAEIIRLTSRIREENRKMDEIVEKAMADARREALRLENLGVSGEEIAMAMLATSSASTEAGMAAAGIKPKKRRS